MQEIAYDIIDLIVVPWNYTFTIFVDLSPGVSVSIGDITLAIATIYILLSLIFDLINFNQGTEEEK